MDTKPRTCTRQGCLRKLSPDSTSTTCCLTCLAAKTEMIKAERICTVVRDGEYWAAMVAFNDALSDLKRNESRVFNSAINGGTTLGEWRAIQRGVA